MGAGPLLGKTIRASISPVATEPPNTTLALGPLKASTRAKGVRCDPPHCQTANQRNASPNLYHQIVVSFQREAPLVAGDNPSRRWAPEKWEERGAILHVLDKHVARRRERTPHV